MLSSHFFSDSGQAAADGRQQVPAPDPRNPEIRRPRGCSCGENPKDNARILPQALAMVADWWPLFVAGIVIAILI